MSLAIESGATTTVAVYVDESAGSDDKGTSLKRYHFGAANFKLLKPTQLEAFLHEIKSTTNQHAINKIGIGMPGIVGEQDKKALKRAVDKVWPNLATVWVGNDTDTALACIDDTKYAIKCIVISGTGSCCYGNNGSKTAKIGGHGHIIGDRGSGYAISHMALREALKDYEYNHFTDDTESHEDKSVLINSLLKHLNLQSIYELVGWSVVASKAEIADLAQLVIKVSLVGNAIARRVVEMAIDDLVNDIKCLISRLRNGSQKPEENTIQIGFTGSLLSRSETFSARVGQKLRQAVPDVDIIVLKDTVMGALRMIRPQSNGSGGNGVTNGILNNHMSNEQLSRQILPDLTALSLTEQRNQRSTRLDSMGVRKGIELMISEEEKSFAEIRKQIDSIETLIHKISHAFKNNGRLFYVGSGTSGRLGILDASECPPTFSSPSYLIQGIIAGGNKALFSAVEGAEDSIVDGINAIEDKDITENDVVIGIAACGRTPFVWGALYAAISRKAYTCLLCFNPHIKPKISPDMVLTVTTGPEVLTGSTRLKAGTATKCVLNMLTTLSMVESGKCFENLMIDLRPANDKLRDRALRISLLLLADKEAEVDELALKQSLQKFNYDIKRTVLEWRKTSGTKS